MRTVPMLLVLMGALAAPVSAASLASRHAARAAAIDEAMARRDFDRAEKLIDAHLADYFDESGEAISQGLEAWKAIDHLGYIYLRVKRDPRGLADRLAPLAQDPRLDDPEALTIEEWLGAARDWLRYPRPSRGMDEPEELLDAGRKAFRLGMADVESPGDVRDNRALEAAARHLVPLVNLFPESREAGEALLMLATIRHHAPVIEWHWGENYYLKEAIRRFPGTALAREAHRRLDEQIHFGYTGSSGDHTPPAVSRMLEDFGERARKGAVRGGGES